MEMERNVLLLRLESALVRLTHEGFNPLNVKEFVGLLEHYAIWLAPKKFGFGGFWA
jgi:hypothetical protein